jgi:hypothetical protein
VKSIVVPPRKVAPASRDIDDEAEGLQSAASRLSAAFGARGGANGAKAP